MRPIVQCSWEGGREQRNHREKGGRKARQLIQMVPATLDTLPFGGCMVTKLTEPTDLVDVEVLAAVVAAKHRHGDRSQRDGVLSGVDKVQDGRLKTLGVVGAPHALHEAPEVGQRRDEGSLDLSQPLGQF